LLRQTKLGFRRFNGKGGPVDLMLRRLDEPQYSRDDLEGGNEEEDGEYGLRLRWQDYIVMPLIDASNGGAELYGFETRNVTSWWAAKNLIGRCASHRMFVRGRSPIIKLEVQSYKHQKYGTKQKPVLAICGWAGPDGATTVDDAQPSSPLPDFNDSIPY
jgi:hypothetical protein